MPIAGAPRTAMSRIAVAQCTSESIFRYSSRAGSRRWSISLTRPSTHSTARTRSKVEEREGAVMASDAITSVGAAGATRELLREFIELVTRTLHEKYRHADQRPLGDPSGARSRRAGTSQRRA